MDYGVAYFPTHSSARPGEVARLCEEHGFESLFFPEHSHIPASRDSPWPGGDELPSRYSHTYDLFVALTAAALATSRLRIGSSICLLIQRDPITTAKEVASIDHLSGGRFEFGVGAGWNREEMRNHGTDPRTRMRLLREQVEAMKAIWTESEASYHGEFVDFDRIWSWPKPLQLPHPPVLVGGEGPTVEERVLAFGDAWIPNYFPGIGDRWQALEARADRPIELDLHMLLSPPTATLLAEAAELGARRVVRWIPSGGRPIVERALEAWGRTIVDFTGETWS